MARIVPDGWREFAAGPSRAGALVAGSALAQRHHDTLSLLSGALPEAFSVYHAVHWTTVERGFSVFGEIDFAVVRGGAVLLIAQKTGFLEEGSEGLLKRDRGRTVNLALQMAHTVTSLREKLARRPGCESVVVDYLLYCPDHRVRRVESAGLSAGRIVDASQRDRLPAVIRDILAENSASAASQMTQQIDRFFRDVIELETDVSALVGQAEAMVTRISGGLAHWARELDFQPFRLHVQGTAGSGKTQLALAECRDAIARGARPLYVCYNRPLSDRITQIAPREVEVANFHQLCERRLRAAGQTLQYGEPGVFDALARRMADLPVDPQAQVDDLIIDEGQDFEQAWVAPLLSLVTRKGRVWWLEDPMQNLYDRPSVALPGWTVLRARTNYRNPRDIVDYLGKLVDKDAAPEAASPFAQAVETLITYDDPRQLIDATTRAITQAMQAGFRSDEIAVVTFAGRERSALRSFDQLGSVRLRSATGRYDLTGAAEYSDGDVLIETVYRFKGQSAPCVILTEVDFAEWSDIVARKLFVGMTRASMRLAVVLSARAAELLMKRLS